MVPPTSPPAAGWQHEIAAVHCSHQATEPECWPPGDLQAPTQMLLEQLLTLQLQHRPLPLAKNRTASQLPGCMLAGVRLGNMQSEGRCSISVSHIRISMAETTRQRGEADLPPAQHSALPSCWLCVAAGPLQLAPPFAWQRPPQPCTQHKVLCACEKSFEPCLRDLQQAACSSLCLAAPSSSLHAILPTMWPADFW